MSGTVSGNRVIANSIPFSNGAISMFQDMGQGAAGRVASWMAWTADPSPMVPYGVESGTQEVDLLLTIIMRDDNFCPMLDGISQGMNCIPGQGGGGAISGGDNCFFQTGNGAGSIHGDLQDSSGNYLFDSAGNPLFSSGYPTPPIPPIPPGGLQDNAGNTLYDSAGNPLFSSGAPAPTPPLGALQDSSGNYLFDDAGHPIYSSGAPQLVDSAGNPLFDSYGNPIFGSGQPGTGLPVGIYGSSLYGGAVYG